MTSKKNKKTIEVEIDEPCDIINYIDGKSLGEAAQYLKELEKKLYISKELAPKYRHFSEFRLKWRQDPYSDYYSLKLIGIREETDQEQ
jgi:hypothetical protein